MPPDEDMADLIEQAFLEDRLMVLKTDLAYLWLRAKQWQNCANCYPQDYPKTKGYTVNDVTN